MKATSINEKIVEISEHSSFLHFPIVRTSEYNAEPRIAVQSADVQAI